MNFTFPLKSIFTMTVAASLIGGLAYASESAKPAGMTQGMMNPADQDKAMRSMQDNMLKMHDLMHRINAAKSPAERESLKLEQRQLMQSNMQSMMPMMMQMMGGMGNMGSMGKAGSTGNMNGMPGMDTNGKGGMPMQR